MKKLAIKPLDYKHGCIDMSHGSGGKAMAQLIDELFAEMLQNEFLGQGNDGALLPRPKGRLVISTDSHVVTPIFFPGGDIGSLSVHGTLNDIAVMGATPCYLAVSFILEEGFALADLKRVVLSMAIASKQAGVCIVTGDTKVVERGKCDGIFITTTGVGVMPEGLTLGGSLAQAGDKILLSGSIGDHGMAILSQREGLSFDSPIVSDSAALHELIATMLASEAHIKTMRDPTRGGVATTLNEICRQSDVGMLLQEHAIPVSQSVAAACEFLGMDPLYVANEGKLIAICAAQDADMLLSVMRAHPLGAQAAIIGEVLEDSNNFVQMSTTFGGRRVVDWLSGEQLPRIC